MCFYSGNMAVIGQKWLSSGKLVYSSKSGCIRQSVCIRAKVTVFGKRGCIWAKVVVF